MTTFLILIGLIGLALVSLYAGFYAERKKSLRGEKVTKDTVAGTAWVVFFGVGLIVVLILYSLK